MWRGYRENRWGDRCAQCMQDCPSFSFESLVSQDTPQAQAHWAGVFDTGLALSLGPATMEDLTQEPEMELLETEGAVTLVWLSLSPDPHRRWPSSRGTLSWRRSSRPTKTPTLVSSAHFRSLMTVGLWGSSGACHDPCRYGDVLREGPV